MTYLLTLEEDRADGGEEAELLGEDFTAVVALGSILQTVF